MLISVFASLFVCILLIAAGYVAGHANGRYQDAAAITRVQRRQDIEQLARLRVFIETETDGVTVEQALLLTDVCTQLGYGQAETQHIVGAAYLMVVDAPIEVGS